MTAFCRQTTKSRNLHQACSASPNCPLNPTTSRSPSFAPVTPWAGVRGCIPGADIRAISLWAMLMAMLCSLGEAHHPRKKDRNTRDPAGVTCLGLQESYWLQAAPSQTTKPRVATLHSSICSCSGHVHVLPTRTILSFYDFMIT